MFKILNSNKFSFIGLILLKIISSFIFFITFLSIIYLFFNLNSVVPLKVKEIIDDPNRDITILNKIISEYFLDKNIIFRLIKFWQRFFTGELYGFSSINEKIGVYSSSLTQNFNYWIDSNKYTFTISFISLLLSIPISFILSFLAAIKRFSWIDYTLNSFVLTILSIPIVVFIPLCNILLNFLGIDYNFDYNNFWKLIYPTLSLITFNCFSWIQILRPIMIEITQSNSYNFLRQMGFSQIKMFLYLFIPRSINKALTALPFYLISIFFYGIYLETFYNFPGTMNHFYGVITNYETDSACYFLSIVIILFMLTTVITQSLNAAFKNRWNNG